MLYWLIILCNVVDRNIKAHYLNFHKIILTICDAFFLISTKYFY